MSARHITEPGIAGHLIDVIKGVDGRTTRESRIRWIVAYRGEIDYTGLNGERLTFRYAKDDSWSDGGWNYKTKEEFETQYNGRWGMLVHSTDPVDRETLEIFRKEHFPSAVTGYFDHIRKCWVECEPTDQKLGSMTWEQYRKTPEYAAEWGTP